MDGQKNDEINSRASIKRAGTVKTFLHKNTDLYEST